MAADSDAARHGLGAERTDGMKIREAGPGDVFQLQSIWIEFMDFHSDFDEDYARAEDAVANWTQYIQSKFDDDSAAVFVAIEKEAVIGYVAAWIRDYPPVYTLKKFGYIEAIAVTRKYRRQGIASMLLDAAESWLSARGMKRIKVNIDSANGASLGFFRSRGYLDHMQTMVRKC